MVLQTKKPYYIGQAEDPRMALNSRTHRHSSGDSAMYNSGLIQGRRARYRTWTGDERSRASVDSGTVLGDEAQDVAGSDHGDGLVVLHDWNVSVVLDGHQIQALGHGFR